MSEKQAPPAPVDLAALAGAELARQPTWSHSSADLNVNLLVIDAPGGVPEHVNDEVDVLFVGIAGAGTIVIEDTARTLAAGTALVVPKGVRRSVQVTEGRMAYLTCHRRRAGLWPRGVPRPGERPGPARREGP